MPHGIRRLSLSQESASDLGVQGELRMQHLHCNGASVPMGRLEHDRHSADAKHAVERVLPVQDGTETRARALQKFTAHWLCAIPPVNTQSVADFVQTLWAGLQ